MSNLLLEPNEQNLLNTYLNDSIDRNEELFYFLKMLNDIPGGNAIALNGAWGSGKTFFVKQAKMILDAYNINNDNDEFNDYDLEQIRDKLASIARKYSQSSKLNMVATVYYDAWKNDSSNDPLLSLVYSVITRFKKDLPVDRKEKIKELGKVALPILNGLVDHVFGVDAKAALESLKVAISNGQDFLQEVESQHKLEKQINKLLDELLYDDEQKLVIFIDELDRCNPLYAIKLLERVKHYFSHPKVVFVFSCNFYELQHSIKSVYGTGLDAVKYLQKFFNINIELKTVDTNKYLESLGADSSILDTNIKTIASMYDFHMREACQYYVFMQKAVKRISIITRDDWFNTNRSLCFYINWFMPYLVGMKFHNYDSYVAFKEGRGFDGFLAFVESNSRLSNGYFDFLLSPNDTYKSNSADGANKIVDILKNKLRNAYLAMFASGTYDSEAIFGTVTCDFNIRRIFWNVVEGVSFLADYTERGNNN